MLRSVPETLGEIPRCFYGNQHLFWFFGHFSIGCLLTWLYAETPFNFIPTLFPWSLSQASLLGYFKLAWASIVYSILTYNPGHIASSRKQGTILRSLINRYSYKIWTISRKLDTLKDSLETLRQDFSLNIFRSKHKWPQSHEDWGYYLAGLIDADGSFTDVTKNKPNLTIGFHIKDISLAYRIKAYIGYGHVSKIKKKQACIYVLTKRLGFIKLLTLLNNKLKHKKKYERYIKLCNFYHIKPENKKDISLKKTYWLAGFIDGDASLQIKVYQRPNRYESRLQLQIDQHENHKNLLTEIKEEFGGNIYKRKHQPSFYYNSTSLKVYAKFIEYLEQYQLNSKKYNEYVIWKKAFFYRHDPQKIKKLKQTITKLKQ